MIKTDHSCFERKASMNFEMGLIVSVFSGTVTISAGAPGRGCISVSLVPADDLPARLRAHALDYQQVHFSRPGDCDQVTKQRHQYRYKDR